MTNENFDEIQAPWVPDDISAADLESPHWQAATPILIARRWSGEEASPEQHAEARIVWNDQALCVRFVCRQHGPLIVSTNPQLNKKTIGVWDRDVCEIFIAPDPNEPERYFEFEAAPNGEWVDIALWFDGPNREADYNYLSGMTVSASLSDEQLMVGIRLPWSKSIARPERGKQWRVNLFRCVGTGNERYLAWLPTYTAEPNFHVPAAFGWLTFV
jgi:alpha-galactosidase